MGEEKRSVRSRRQKQLLRQVRRPSNAGTVADSAAQGSDCTVTACAAEIRTDTPWAHNPLSFEIEGGQQTSIIIIIITTATTTILQHLPLQKTAQDLAVSQFLHSVFITNSI